MTSRRRPGTPTCALTQRAANLAFTTVVRTTVPFVAKVSATGAGSGRGDGRGDGRGTLVVLNHRSPIDFPVAAVACRRWRLSPAALSRADFFDRPLAGPGLRLLGAIPAGVRHSPAATLDAAGRVLRAGGAVAIAPEGRIVTDAQRPDGLGRFEPGVGVLVSRFHPHILLVALTGTDAAWPPHHRLPALRPPWKRPSVEIATRWLDLPADTTPSEATARVHAELQALLTPFAPGPSRIR
jgi:1-acyl-sn-glycerol-3-phosphate acyltransferase